MLSCCVQTRCHGLSGRPSRGLGQELPGSQDRQAQEAEHGRSRLTHPTLLGGLGFLALLAAIVVSSNRRKPRKTTPDPLELTQLTIPANYRTLTVGPPRPPADVQPRRTLAYTTMARSDPPRRVVITGIGIVSPLGVGAKALLGRPLRRHRRRGQPDHRLRPQRLRQPGRRAGAAVQGRRSSSPRTIARRINVMARDIELAVVAADDAVQATPACTPAGAWRSPPTSPTFDGSRFGCNIGAGLISVDLNELTSAMATSKDGDRLEPRPSGATSRHAASSPRCGCSSTCRTCSPATSRLFMNSKGRATRSPAATPAVTWPSARPSAPSSGATPIWPSAAGPRPRSSRWA